MTDETAFVDWIKKRLGTSKWCVASRSTEKLREKYEIVLTYKRYSELHTAWENGCNP